MNVVAEAVDGEEAVSFSRLLKPDLVLMDLDLPRLDGLQATRRLKVEFTKTRVIILSTVGDETCRRAAAKYGADAFLPKGTDIARLLSLIREGSLNGTPQDNRLAGQN